MTTHTRKTPLEMLVLSQLTAIRRQESALKTQLCSNSSVEPANIAANVWKLQASADRLNRMIDAMGVSGSYVRPSVGTPAAA